jgi:Zn-dependent peptidase ImmA (M78 family)/DNA-binding XRE family transcriptional regulator
MTDDPLGELRGDRLTVLRDLKGLTQDELAQMLGVSQSFLSHVEKGSRPLPRSVALHASSACSVPLAFFRADPGVAGLGPFTFRKKASARAKDERRVTALYTEAARLFHAVSSASGFQTRQLPDPANFEHDPEACAVALRTSAGLAADEPVKNVARLLERHGIGVVTHLDDSQTVISDHVGVSRPTSLNDRPLIATVHELPGAVQRLSLGHEAGHWVFDGQRQLPIAGTRSLEEARAFQFGGALLIPEVVIRQRVTENLSLHSYMRIKADYGISIAAIIRRAKDLGVITAARYRSLSIQISSQGWRLNEPVEVGQEAPRLMDQALTQVYGPRRVHRASEEHGIDPRLIQRWAGKEAEPTGTNANVIELRPAR